MNPFFYIRKAANQYSHLFWTPLNRISLKINGVQVQKGLRVRGKIYIFRHKTSSQVHIGEGVTFNSAPWANPIGFDGRCRIQMVEGGVLEIGDGCGISNTAITCADHIRIGKNVLIGAGVKIYDTDFHPLDYEQRMKGYAAQEQVKTAPVMIGDGAFIGAGSIILKGAVIGEHSVIGAGSVVRGHVPAGEVWAGNPARFCRKLTESPE